MRSANLTGKLDPGVRTMRVSATKSTDKIERSAAAIIKLFVYQLYKLAKFYLQERFDKAHFYSMG